MTVYFQIAELYDTPYRSIYPFVNGGTNTFNAANVRSSIGITEGDDSYQWVASPPFSSTDLWVHFRIYIGPTGTASGPTANQSMFRIFAGGTQRIRVTPNGGDGQLLEIWNGSSWTTLTSYYASNLNNNQISTYDVHAKVGPAETITVYRNGTIILNATNVDTTFGGTVTAFDSVYWGCPNIAFSGSFSVYYSEMIGANWNTIGSKLVSRGPDANGTYSEWTNDDFTIVDDVGLNGDYATSDAPNQRSDWSMTNFPAPAANEQIVSVELNAMINRDNTGPQSANFYIRQGSIDYDAADKPVNITQALIKERYETNPATSELWTDTTLNASTFGIRSRT